MTVPTSREVSPDDARFMARFLAESTEALKAFAHDTQLLDTLALIAREIADAMRTGGKLLIAGNGGSAADAQHISGELTGRLMYDRRALAAIALTTDSSSMTAISNDYGYDHVFARQVEALGRKGDVFLGISTSGRSPSILNAFSAARACGMRTVLFCGRNVVSTTTADRIFPAPSEWTPVVQQIHITAAHLMCALIERSLCPAA